MPVHSSNFSVFPNPLADNSVLSVSLVKNAALSYQIFDMLGNLIETTDLGFLQANNYQFELNTAHLPKGVYFIHMNYSDFSNKTIRIIK